MAAVRDRMLIEAGRDNHQHLLFPFVKVKLNKDRSESYA